MERPIYNLIEQPYPDVEFSEVEKVYRALGEITRAQDAALALERAQEEVNQRQAALDRFYRHESAVIAEPPEGQLFFVPVWPDHPVTFYSLRSSGRFEPGKPVLVPHDSNGENARFVFNRLVTGQLGHADPSQNLPADPSKSHVLAEGLWMENRTALRLEDPQAEVGLMAIDSLANFLTVRDSSGTTAHVSMDDIHPEARRKKMATLYDPRA